MSTPQAGPRRAHRPRHPAALTGSSPRATPTTALRHLAELLTYAGTRRGHDRRDAAMADEMTVAAADLGLPPGLEVRWLGVAGVALVYEGTTVLIDPYVTRLPMGDLMRRRVIAADPAAIDRWVPRADAVLLGHTHFDHALDAPAIARRDRATVYGGASAVALMGLHGLADRAVAVAPHVPIEIGPFEVTFVPSVHSKLVLGRTVPNGGEITCEHMDGLTPKAYQCGEVWGIHIAVAGASLYHQGSADLLDDEVRHREVDVFLCGVAGRQVSDRYFPRILRRLDPKVVVAMHHDDFFVPLARPDQGFAFGVDLARVPDEVAETSCEAPVVVLERARPA